MASPKHTTSCFLVQSGKLKMKNIHQKEVTFFFQSLPPHTFLSFLAMLHMSPLTCRVGHFKGSSRHQGKAAMSAVTIRLICEDV